MKRIDIIIFCVLSAVFFVSAQTNKDYQINEQEKKYIRLYFDAEKYKLLEDYHQALILYEKCVQMNPKESSAYNEIAKIYFYSNQWENAEYYIKEAIKRDFNNQWYHYLLIDIYVIQNKLEDQLEVYSDLISVDPENYLYYVQKIQVLKALSMDKQAIKFIKKTESKFGSSDELLIELISVYLLQDNFKSAEKAALKLVNKFPANKLGYHELSKVYMHYSNYDKAIETYNRLLHFYPNEPRAIIALYKIYINKKDLKKQEIYLNKIATSSTINLETKKEIFYELLMKQDVLTSIDLKPIIKSALETYPKDPLFNLIMGDLLSKDEKYSQAILHYNDALQTVFIKDQYIYNKLMEIHFVLGEFDRVINTADQALEKHPFDSGFYYFKALALINQKKYSNAIEILLKGEQYVVDNMIFKSEFFALIGDSYHKINNHIESDKAYEDALRYNKNNTFVLNNYSYYLSLRGVSLQKAKEMTMICNELTKDEPKASFLDTYAWVLYKLEEYELAKEQIEKAIDLDATSPTLWEHYGDILYELGLTQEAVDKWRQAFLLNNTASLKKKIKQNE